MADEAVESDESATVAMNTEAEIRELLGMFDAPSFARRGHGLEFMLARIHDRCRIARSQMLDMVRMRLKQWSQVSEGFDAWRGIFKDPISDLWPLSGADESTWSEIGHPIRRRRAVARDLIASIARFNDRWSRHVQGLKLEPVNEMIRQYNQFYILEKECVLGSARLAARFFRPEPMLSSSALLHVHPILPVPELA